ncbi:MAG: tetratricopeptide repeat protein [Candidatus Lokiarchaeota archaeon]|nr:tetratricopeptide repeat protein [Candidatus Lokiarchaeota archaeon]
MTNDSPLYEKIEVPIKSLFPLDRNYAFLAGAGISMDSPSDMPSAKQMVIQLLKLVAPEEEVHNILQLDSLRFVTVVELIQNIIDMDLRFLDYMELITTPNLIHFFLSRLIVKGHSIVTTNFDYLLEYALKQILPAPKYKNIRIFATKQNYIDGSLKPEILQNAYNLVKIHGSKRNVITITAIQDSIVTTTSALGSDRSEEDTFLINSNKKDVIYSLMKDRTLVVVGYSGNDDFGISSLVNELPFLSRVIWIEHSNQDKFEILRFRKLPVNEDEENYVENQNKSHPPLDLLLSNLHMKHGYETLLIRGNTKILIQHHLWSIFHPDVPAEIHPPSSGQLNTSFNDFVLKQYRTITGTQKYLFGTQLFFKLKQIPAAVRCARRGLASASITDALAAKSTFLTLLGLSYQLQEEHKKALDFYSRALLVNKELGNIPAQASLLNNIGSVYRELRIYEKAISHHELALRICEELGDVSGKITALDNLGRVHEKHGQYQKAKDYYITALDFADKTGDLERKVILHNNIGKIISSEDPNTAILHYKNALKVTELLGDLQGQNILYNNIGAVLQEKGDLETAISMFKKTALLAEKLGSMSKKAEALSNLGSVYLIRSDLEKSVEYFKEASILEENLGNPKLAGLYYNKIGIIMQKTGKLEKAIEFYKKALLKFESIADMHNIAIILSKLGDCTITKKQYTEAIRYFQWARKLYASPELDDLENYAAITNNLAKCYENIGKHTEALRYYEETLEIHEELGDIKQIAVDFFNIGKIQQLQEHLPIAVDNLRKALDLFSQLGMEDQVKSIQHLLNTL